MTTLVALITKDALVMGCDSLGSITKRLIDPRDLMKFFDPAKNFDELKLDENGKPLIKSFEDIYAASKSIPSEHMTHMTKMFSLEPLKAAVMLTGITSISERTIRSLVKEFQKAKIKSIEMREDYSVQDIAEQLLDHIVGYYEKEFPEEKDRPGLELILGGYGNSGVIPEVYRIRLPEKKINRSLEEGHFGIVFGGQMTEIQRIVFGTDAANRLKLQERHTDILRKYREKIIEFLKSKNISEEIPELTKDESKELNLLTDGWDLEGFYANWGDFSEQNAVDCVDFFVNIMIKSQQFSRGMPTVGGEVHVMLITKEECRFVSKEEYHHAGHYSLKHHKDVV